MDTSHVVSPVVDCRMENVLFGCVELRQTRRDSSLEFCAPEVSGAEVMVEFRSVMVPF